MARARPLTRAWQQNDEADYDLSADSASRLAMLVARNMPEVQSAREYDAHSQKAGWAHARACAAAQAHGLRVEADILGTAIAAAERDVAAERETTPRVVLGWFGALQARAAARPAQ